MTQRKIYDRNHYAVLLVAAAFLLLRVGQAYSIEEVLPDLVLQYPNEDVKEHFYTLNANFSPDAKKVVVGCTHVDVPQNTTAHSGYTINDAEDGRELARARSSVMVAGFSHVCFSPDGKSILAGESGMYGGDTVLLNAKTGEEIWRKKAQPSDYSYPDPLAPPPDRRFYCAGFSFEGDRVFSTVDDYTIIRDATTGEEMLSPVGGARTGTVFLPGGDQLFTPLKDHPTIYDLLTGEVLQQYVGYNGSISPDGLTIFLAAQDGNAQDSCRLRSSITGDMQRQMPCLNFKGSTPMLTPDTNRVFYREDNVNRRTAILADLTHAGITPLRSFLIPEDDPGIIQRVRYAPDGSRFLVQTRNATYLYDISDLTSTVQDARAYGK